MAEDGLAMEVGVVPGNLGEKKDATLAKLAEILNIDEKSIETALSATWVKDELFVPIKTIANNEEVKQQLKELDGVQLQTTVARVYPLAEKAAHVTGYVGLISAEELAAMTTQGYDETSLVGKAGLEGTYEETLHGEDGVSIIIKDKNGMVKKNFNY